MVSFKRANQANKTNQRWMDSLIHLLRSSKMGGTTQEYYYYARNITSRGISVQHNNRTFEQLKGSGGLRVDP
jgi:hypothetical protein